MNEQPNAAACLGATAVLLILLGFALAPSRAEGQTRSPKGSSAIEVGGHFDVRLGYTGGSWIRIDYGRPILRERDIFGPADWIEALNDGAELWRAGANYTTELTTDIPLTLAGVAVDPGTYTVFIELGNDRWTFVLSNWPAQKSYDYENKEALFGAYYYTPDRDVLRTTMKVERLGFSFEQLSWQFLDVEDGSGRLALLWDDRLASVEFSF